MQERGKMEYAIEMLNITKKFGHLTANDNITLKIQKNEIHALIGENGAGKSTLMNQLFGLLSPTSGTIKINGKVVLMSNPNVATNNGLGMVHQHFQLIDTHTVLENILLGKEGTKLGQPINFRAARTKLLQLSKMYNLDIDPDTEIRDLTVGQQQKVEILKMLYSGAEILIFDEPTAMLTPQEIEGLLEIFRTFKKKGKTIVFISHKMNEIKDVADNFTVIRRGAWVGTKSVASSTIKDMSEMMVGRQLVEIKNNSTTKKGMATVLDVKGINVKHFSNPQALGLKNATFDVKAGEIVAIAGVEGNGQTELAYAISGIQKPISGSIQINGKTVTRSSTRKRYQAGLSFLPEDRYKHAMFAKQNLFSNFIMQRFHKKPFSKFGILLGNQKEKQTRAAIKQFDVRGANEGLAIIGSLSGGNQQKFIAAREMTKDHSLLMLFQPTRGLDIGAIEYLHSKILEEKAEGKAVLLISYDLGEIMSLADRIVVVSGGDVINVVNAKDVTRNQLGKWMGGAK